MFHPIDLRDVAAERSTDSPGSALIFYKRSKADLMLSGRKRVDGDNDLREHKQQKDPGAGSQPLTLI